MIFNLVPSASYWMGSNTNQALESNVTPVTYVTLSSFYISKYETTYAEWTNVVNWATNNGYSFDTPAGADGYNPSGVAIQNPVVSIDWYDCIKWCNALSEWEGRTPCYYTSSNFAAGTVYRTGDINLSNYMVNMATNGYRLPTEAEREYAERGGASYSTFYWGESTNVSVISNYAWYSGDCSGTYQVGLLAPNSLGLYDIAGNVYNWCWDWWSNYSGTNEANPLGPVTGSYRILRGGSCRTGSSILESAYRNNSSPSGGNDDIGLRPVRTE
jgi:formylglycine-generating enzyme required for sulfatase activity